ncbi:MAG: DUF881 domain-containing protein [Streptosporangiaceae bacterium]
MGRGWRSPWAVAVPVVTLLAGGLFAVSGSAAHGTDLRGGRRTELTQLIATQQRRGQQYRAEVKHLRAEIDAAGDRVGDRDARVREARKDASRYAGPAGMERVSGAGIRVTLDDAPRPRPGETRSGNPAPNDLVVHQQDVQAVVNALWAGGARAMEIMDQRVISTSAVRCVGNTLLLQGAVYSPPYTIAAVGNPRLMRAALDASPEVRVYRDYVDAYGLGYHVEGLDRVTVPAYSGAIGLRYATVPES